MAASVHPTNPNPRLVNNICDQPDVILQPIGGYQKAELVSLEKAIEPIQLYFHNLRDHASIAKAASKKPFDGLIPDESAAIYLYTLELQPRSMSSVLNKILCDRNRQKLKPWFPYFKLLLSGLFKISSCPTKIIWHGVKADLRSKYEIGKNYTWWGFTSCALSVEVLQHATYVGETGVRTVFSIECLNGKPIMAHSSYKNEEEILLLPGTCFEVVSNLDTGHGLHIIRGREILPPFVLREPPFETQLMSLATSNIEQVLDKIYEMNKDNEDVPKLFVVLPDPKYEWKSEDIWKNSFLLHLVCESSIDHIHFALHRGYSLPNSQVFFQIYGHYLKQFMIPLAHHLFDHKIFNSFQDTRFWDRFMDDLNKMNSILNEIGHNVLATKQTSKLKDLLVPEWMTIGNLSRSITEDMKIRLVCKRHLSPDQVKFIRELSTFEGITFDEQESEMTISGQLDSGQVSRLSTILSRGLRIYAINYVQYTPPLDQLNQIFCRASILAVCHQGYLSDNKNKSAMERLQRLCTQVIASNPRVRKVSVCDAGTRSTIRIGIRDALKSNGKLRSFTFSGTMNNQGVTEIISAWKSNQMLTTLQLKDHPLPSKGAQTIADFIRSSRTLTNLTLSNTMIKNEGCQVIIDAICFNPIMKILELSFNNIRDKSGSYIAQLLQVCTSLRSLDISYNEITAIGARPIFEKLKMNRTLLHFNIGLNNLIVKSGGTITTTSKNDIVNIGELISAMLLENKSLMTLDITHINMSDFGVQMLAKALPKNSTLAHLNLCSNKLFDIRRKSIIDALHVNHSLISLDLSYNEMNDASVVRLGEMLRVNQKLRYLKAQCCVIDDSRIFSLARAVQNNLTLTHLDISKNTIGDYGAMVIADILAKNSTLIYLNIADNRITDQGVRSIANALEINNR